MYLYSFEVLEVLTNYQVDLASDYFINWLKVPINRIA